MELYYVLSIVDRSRAKELLDIHNELQLSLVLTKLGRGTAKTEHLSLYELEPSEKAVIGTVASAASVRQLMRAAKLKMFIDIPGNGVMMALPVKSVGGGKNLAYFTSGQILGGTAPNMDFEHEKRLTEVEERTKSNTHRIDDLEKMQDNLDELVGTVKVLAVREENVETDVKEIKNDVKSLTNKSGQRWDGLVDKIIMTIVAAIVGFILAKFGM